MRGFQVGDEKCNPNSMKCCIYTLLFQLLQDVALLGDFFSLFALDIVFISSLERR